jgi:hypothetical protein
MGVNKWQHWGNPFEGPKETDWGFVYYVACKDTNSEHFGKWYIGMKSFWSVTNPRISKKRALEIYSGRGPKKKKEQKIKSSGWETYCSSSKELQSLINELGVDAFIWQIKSIHCSKTELALAEATEILNSGALCDPLCLNNWVSLKIHKSNLNCNK